MSCAAAMRQKTLLCSSPKAKRIQMFVFLQRTLRRGIVEARSDRCFCFILFVFTSAILLSPSPLFPPPPLETVLIKAPIDYFEKLFFVRMALYCKALGKDGSEKPLGLISIARAGWEKLNSNVESLWKRFESTAEPSSRLKRF